MLSNSSVPTPFYTMKKAPQEKPLMYKSKQSRGKSQAGPRKRRLHRHLRMFEMMVEELREDLAGLGPRLFSDEYYANWRNYDKDKGQKGKA
jgi:hypothetical protein